MRQPFKQCILHIGTEKTGSSTIQAFLDLNRKSLLKQGMHYPRTKVVGSQWEFVGMVSPAPWKNDLGKNLNITDSESQEKFKRTFLENFKQEVYSVPGAHTLIISSEHFHSRLHSVEDVAALKKTLDPFAKEFKIIVYFRRQDELAVSHLSTRIKSGFPGSTVFLPPPESPSMYYNYDALVERWAAVFGIDSILGGVYHEVIQSDAGILDDFCSKTNIDIKGKIIPKWQNKSVSAEGLKFIQSLNGLCKSHEYLLTVKERQELILLVSSQNPGKFFPFSRVQAQEFHRQFKTRNEKLKMLLFPDRAEELFHDDFSQYPEVGQKLPEQYEDAVVQTLKIWKATRSRNKLIIFMRRVIRFVKTIF